MLASITSASLLGVTGHVVSVEVHVTRGLPSCSIVGLPDAACREARDRVRAAIVSSELDWPQQRITVNLAPSSLPKLGTGLDLAVAVGLLVAEEEVAAEATEGTAFLGELGLDGSVRSVRGVVALVAALRQRVERVVVPASAAVEASLVPGVDVLCANDLAELVAALRVQRPWPDPPAAPVAPPEPAPDLADVRGQPSARAALEIAAAGGHHLLLSGPPGAGKTMLANRLPGLLPDLDDDDALEATRVHSAAGLPVAGLVRRPPFRSPHHTSSAVSLIGGGSSAMRPGEISLAHAGVLFCDELGEFAPTVLDAMRQPLESGVVRVSRARGSVEYPARFQLVAATNPCPCGPPPRGCRCSDAARSRYLRRLSGPLLDRIDLRIDVERPDADALLRDDDGEPTHAVAARVRAARVVAADRGLRANADLEGGLLQRHAPVTADARRLLAALVRNGSLSGRGVTRIRRVARTVADLAGHDGVLEVDHVATALAFRTHLGADAPAVAS